MSLLSPRLSQGGQHELFFGRRIVPEKLEIGPSSFDDFGKDGLNVSEGYCVGAYPLAIGEEMMAEELDVIGMARCEGQNTLDGFRLISQYPLDGLHNKSDGFVPIQKPNLLFYASR